MRKQRQAKRSTSQKEWVPEGIGAPKFAPRGIPVRVSLRPDILPEVSKFEAELNHANVQMRKQPQQGRARDALERILLTTGELLDEAGFEALTTITIAARARVNIATLYSFFPNKFEIVKALTMRLEAERHEAVEKMLKALATQPDWRSPLRRMISEAARLRGIRPGGRTLRRALQSSPELWQIDHEMNSRLIVSIARALCRRKPELSEKDARLVSITALTTISALLDIEGIFEVDKGRLRDEAGKILENYLAVYLD